MKRNSLLLIIVLIGLTVNVSAQCYIKSTDQSAGHVTYYLDPELVAQTQDMGIALSVQMVGNNYYLAVTYQFASTAVPLEEKVAIELKNGYTLELEMYTMQVANASGVELTLAVFNMTDDQMKYFTQSDLAAIHFRTQKGVEKNVPVTNNPAMLRRQLKCFGK